KSAAAMAAMIASAPMKARNRIRLSPALPKPTSIRRFSGHNRRVAREAQYLCPSWRLARIFVERRVVERPPQRPQPLDCLGDLGRPSLGLGALRLVARRFGRRVGARIVRIAHHCFDKSI